MFIVFEGPDGSGKSTIAHKVYMQLSKLYQSGAFYYEFPVRANVPSMVSYLTDKDTLVTPAQFQTLCTAQRYLYTHSKEELVCEGIQDKVPSLAEYAVNTNRINIVTSRWSLSGIIYGAYDYNNYYNIPVESAIRILEDCDSIVLKPNLTIVLMSKAPISTKRLKTDGDTYDTASIQAEIWNLYNSYIYSDRMQKHIGDHEIITDVDTKSIQEVYDEVLDILCTRLALHVR